MSSPKKVVLAYSGGLDTSIILKWLQTEYGCEVVTFTADLGQGEELEPARSKAELLGVRPENIFIEDLREEFVRDFVFPMFRANAALRGPVPARHLDRPAADRQAPGRDRRGDRRRRDRPRRHRQGQRPGPLRARRLRARPVDQGDRALARVGPDQSRTKLLEFAEAHQIPIAKDKRGEAPFSVDANLLHTSSEGKVLEDPAEEAPAYVYQRTVDPEEAPDAPEYVEIGFERGDPVSVERRARCRRRRCSTRLNELGGRHGVGRLDLVENRFVGMKSRGIYETPGGTMLLAAHRGIESITLDRGRGAPQGRADAAVRRADLQRLLVLARARDAAGADRQEPGARDAARSGSSSTRARRSVVGRASPRSLYSESHVTFEDDAGAYDQKDAAGFIKLNALRLRLLGMRDRR